MKEKMLKFLKEKKAIVCLLVSLVCVVVVASAFITPIKDDNLPEDTQEILEDSNLVYKSYNENVYWIDQDLTFENAMIIVDNHFENQGYKRVVENESFEEFVARNGKNVKGFFAPVMGENATLPYFLDYEYFVYSSFVDNAVSYEVISVNGDLENAHVAIIDYSDYALNTLRGKDDALHVSTATRIIEEHNATSSNKDYNAEATVAFMQLFNPTKNQTEILEKAEMLALNLAGYYNNAKYLIFNDVVVIIASKDSNILMKELMK